MCSQCAPLGVSLRRTLKAGCPSDGMRGVGSVIELQCPSTPTAVKRQSACPASLSRFEDDGFRLALLVSFISLAIILIMSIIFITFCLVRHVKREERRKLERARKTGASEFWQQIDVEGVELQREVLHSQKTTNHNNNNSNSGGERRHTDKTSTSTATETSTLPAGVLIKGSPVL
ncbi:hypothetical protein cypCar_00025237 [Cyprinus carpio]|nr:hypothetical protein cypCar_00025237 [Cyprinus carpio]